MAIYNALSPSWSAWSIFNQADDEFKWCPQIFDGLLQKIYEKPYLFCDRIPCQRSTQIKIRGDEVMCDNSRAFKGIFYRGTISERDQNLILNLVSPWPDTPGAICPSEEKRSSQRHSCDLKCWNLNLNSEHLYQKFADQRGLFVLVGRHICGACCWYL